MVVVVGVNVGVFTQAQAQIRVQRKTEHREVLQKFGVPWDDVK